MAKDKAIATIMSDKPSDSIVPLETVTARKQQIKKVITEIARNTKGCKIVLAIICF